MTAGASAHIANGVACAQSTSDSSFRFVCLCSCTCSIARLVSRYTQYIAMSSAIGLYGSGLVWMSLVFALRVFFLSVWVLFGLVLLLFVGFGVLLFLFLFLFCFALWFDVGCFCF